MSSPIGYVTGSGSATSLSDPLVRAYWSDRLHVESIAELYFTARGMSARMGSPESDDGDPEVRLAGVPLVIIDDLKTKRTQRVRMALQRQLTRNRGLTNRSGSLNSATYGPATMVGNEELMDLYDMEVIVELLKHATAFDTPEIQDLRTSFRMEELARTALGTWMTDQKEESVVDAFEEGNAAHVVAATLASAVTHPNAFYAGAATDDASLQATDTLSAATIRRMYAGARHHRPSGLSTDVPFQPLKVEGGEYFALLAPAYVLNDLNADPVYRQTQERVLNRGTDHPLLTRAQATFEGVCIHEYNRVRKPTSGGNQAHVYHLIFLGAKALVMANATKPTLVLRKEDEYGDRFGVGIKCVFGVGRTDYQNAGNTVTINQSSARWSVYSAASV